MRIILLRLVVAVRVWYAVLSSKRLTLRSRGTPQKRGTPQLYVRCMEPATPENCRNRP